LRLLPAVYLIFLSLVLVTALALLFSTFSSPALSAVFTFFLWVIGHFDGDLMSFGELIKSASMKWLCRVLYYVIPNFSNFKIMDSRSIIQGAGYFQQIDPSAIFWATIYCMIYCAFLIALGISIFMRRDFK
jgi:ABC-type transport system involved in multi-copper enzyme maturation permease subunit